ncbi:MAG: DUF4338 domain-containing protein [Deltaproteobacteria bacterium]|nr:DUF4338 domain-containing protein [Deltaproteobacteria bacterium]MBW1960997.1 DUF4338 domain-containing protein [Deltaproteobacteria bacterium]MBW1992922.1 DUF4338 domain-containing protein [Deltaproteobacteria bacterium]MBW2152764.1 DUF4338 domain-containing protein [Deltaproteobacteria bacterium]
MQEVSLERFCGRTLSGDEIDQIKEIVSTCRGISRTELANTVCELFDWRRPTGRLKTVECRQFLEHLAAKGVFDLPDRKAGRPRGVKFTVKRTDKGQSPGIITGNVKDFFPLRLRKVTTKAQRELWYEYVDRYHYLGYQLPFGAQLRYFIESGNGEDLVVGCLQFSSAAWKMAARDRWIGWSDEQRRGNLQKIVNNSRFLIFPWVKVKNLASSVLALAIRRVAEDWQASYGCRPAVIETLVDRSRFAGTCYKAANFIYVGTTTGRGRMDREHGCHGQSVKDIYVYPLSSRFRQELLGL